MRKTIESVIVKEKNAIDLLLMGNIDEYEKVAKTIDE